MSLVIISRPVSYGHMVAAPVFMSGHLRILTFIYFHYFLLLKLLDQERWIDPEINPCRKTGSAAGFTDFTRASADIYDFRVKTSYWNSNKFISMFGSPFYGAVSTSDEGVSFDGQNMVYDYLCSKPYRLPQRHSSKFVQS